ncbi:hypothetical protein AOLI_G00182980 [Acnodon oligacanthus]
MCSQRRRNQMNMQLILNIKAQLRGPSIFEQADSVPHQARAEGVKWTEWCARHRPGYDSVTSVEDTVGRGPGSKHTASLSTLSPGLHMKTVTKLFVSSLARTAGFWTRSVLLLSRERG